MRFNEELTKKLNKVLTSNQMNKSLDSIRIILEDKLDESRKNALEVTIKTPIEDIVITKEELKLHNLILDAYSSFMEFYVSELDLVN